MYSKTTFKNSTWVMALLATTMIFSSCKKDKEEEEPKNKQVEEPTNIPTFSDADAVLVAVGTSFEMENPFGPPLIAEFGTAVAVFLENNNPEKHIAAGTVSVEGETLTKAENNTYYYPNSATDPFGIDFGYPIAWESSGSSNFPAFSISGNRSMPSVGKLTSETEINQGEEYTLSVDDVMGADSVIFQIAGEAGNVMATKSGITKFHTFTANEINSVGKGQIILQVVAYNIDKQEEQGKTVYLINQFATNEIGECK